VLRRHLAGGKPAYTVLADAALHEIAVARPASLAELSRVRGVGPSKLEQFGAAILAVVEDAAANVQPGAESARDG
jgi:DNA helicase-2/ATP-dependent DNA helicase PcrA